ncbi:hypothetical protein [Paraflavitalea pollutisoli]|uniref:hypothetical protein n=1 Tax=Paraflavitalea pollutisoli TaxID=3034143 RepID=UPI0023ED31C1|nr:hypothetical protein [Paraflavitalea sp. H1-2-19X]
MPNHKFKTMRTTWLILLAMVLAGIAMYYVANRQKPVSPYDTISITNTADSISQKVRVFVAYDPAEVSFRDSTWYEHDSIPLKELSVHQTLNTFDKHYTNATLYIDYGHQWFYDVVVNKPAQDAAYQLNFTINNSADSFRLEAVINDPARDQLHLRGPMMKMYNAFLLTYGNRLSPNTDTTTGPQAPPPARLITVIKK